MAVTLRDAQSMPTGSNAGELFLYSEWKVVKRHVSAQTIRMAHLCP